LAAEPLLYRIKRLLPPSWSSRLRAVRRRARRTRLQAGRHWDRATIALDLGNLGLHSGDVVIVHSSLSKLGFVSGGPEAVIDALLDVLGAQGTLVMPSFPFDTYVADYLEQNRVFDVAATPSRMGAITEVLRRRPGVQRSVHPTHPVVALGPAATTLTTGHERLPATFGAGSPFQRLCELNGKILLLGVDFHTMTNLHVVEDVTTTFPYQTYLAAPIQIELRTGDTVTTMQARVHDPALSRLRDCNKMESYFAQGGVMTKGSVGDAEARLLDAAGVLRVMRELAERGITMYDDERVPDSKRRADAVP
jgi:aminoglycoside 3-N-acetyltransferase